MNYSETVGDYMFKKMFLYFFVAVAFLISFSCAPVKFSKSDQINVNPNVTPTNTNSVVCTPRINSSQITFTYSGSALPSIVSQCTPSEVNYEWVVKRSDMSVVSTVIPGLTGVNPVNVDFNVLGSGVYYVFLNATDSSGVNSPFMATTPLEFVVPGTNVGNSLTCDPKLNSTFTSVVVNSTDSNPTVAANCTPAAGMYLWTVYKDTNPTPVVISGLSGANSTPDFKTFGPGAYRVYLYSTSTGSAHWQSSAPLNVTVAQSVTPPTDTPIQCTPRINGTLTSLTLTSSSSNPLISANCLPANIQYNWTVTRNGQSVSVPNLGGSNSNPNFLSLGTGTYLVYLTASHPSHTAWSSSSPLILTVDSANPGTLTLNCAPRLNSTNVSVSIAVGGTNPTLTSGCSPATASHIWTVYRAGQLVTVPNISGSSSVPDFLSLGVGTYQIYLTASSPNYNSFVLADPLEVIVGPAIVPLRHVAYNKAVTVTDNQVDILLVVDDSNSMAPENTQLAQKLQGFVNDLTASNVDWQMCATVTRAQDVNSNGILYWGASRNWVGYLASPAWVLKLGASDPYAIFTNTIAGIGAGWAGTDDERAIKAAYWHAEYAQYNNCYRPDASLSVIVLSDEDERSVGGDAAQVYYSGELKSLEADDLPQSYVNKVKQKFGNDKRLSVNSIIVKPNDTTCMASQDAGGAKSHYGFKYNELSQLTNGYTGSICAADFSQNLNYFKDRIVRNLSSVNLECAPVGNIAVNITPAMGTVGTALVNNTLVFTPTIPAGRTVSVEYDCPVN
jgi:hypothetical protein